MRNELRATAHTVPGLDSVLHCGQQWVLGGGGGEGEWALPARETSGAEADFSKIEEG